MVRFCRQEWCCVIHVSHHMISQSTLTVVTRTTTTETTRADVRQPSHRHSYDVYWRTWTTIRSDDVCWRASPVRLPQRHVLTHVACTVTTSDDVCWRTSPVRLPQRHVLTHITRTVTTATCADARRPYDHHKRWRISINVAIPCLSIRSRFSSSVMTLWFMLQPSRRLPTEILPIYPKYDLRLNSTNHHHKLNQVWCFFVQVHTNWSNSQSYIFSIYVTCCKNVNEKKSTFHYLSYIVLTPFNKNKLAASKDQWISS